MEAHHQAAFRLPLSLIERVDAYGKQLEAERPGVRVTRADAVRALLEIALRQVESGKGKKR